MKFESSHNIRMFEYELNQFMTLIIVTSLEIVLGIVEMRVLFFRQWGRITTINCFNIYNWFCVLGMAVSIPFAAKLGQIELNVVIANTVECDSED